MSRRGLRASDQTFGSRISYRVDRFLDLHPALQLFAVLGTALFLALGFGLAIYLIDDSAGAAPDQQRRVGGVATGLWWAITRMLDGGTVTNDSGPLRQTFGLGVTLVGMVSVAIVTGSFASSFSDRLSALRRGTLPIFEAGHVVVLGWNVHGGVLLRELAVSGLKITLVIVADHEREVIEESVREQLERWEHNLRVVVRRGDPTTTACARRAAVHKARAVVILPELGGAPAAGRPGDPLASHPGGCLDRVALRSLLAVKRVLGGRRRSVIVDVASARGAELLRLCESTEEVVIVDGHGVNARILAQSVLQDGAFSVIQQILSLDARSVFVHPAGDFEGKTFDEAHAAIENGVLIGISHDDHALLSPDGARAIRPGDHLLVFSDDSRAPRATGHLPREPSAAAADDATRPSDAAIAPGDAALAVLVIRYRPELGEILQFIDGRAASRVTVMVRLAEAAHVEDVLGALSLERTTVVVVPGDPLEGHDIDRVLEARHDVALLLAPDVTAAQMADADADQLITLLHLRRAGESAPRAVVEIRSHETKKLMRPLGRRESFLLKRETVGMLLAQELHAVCLARAGAWVGPVYQSILEAIGPSVALRPLAGYVKGSRPRFAEFAEAQASARRRGEVAIGVAEEGAPPRLLPRREERFDPSRTKLVVIQSKACSRRA